MYRFRLLTLVMLSAAVLCCVSCSVSSVDDTGDGDNSDGDAELEPPIDGDLGPDGDNSSGDGDIEEEEQMECLYSCISVEIEGDSLDFGFVPWGGSNTRKLTINSVGEDSLKIYGIDLKVGTSQEFSIDKSGLTFPMTLAPFNPINVYVTYEPGDLNEDDGFLLLLSNDDIKPRLELPLSGKTGKGETQLAVIDPASDSIEWGDVQMACDDSLMVHKQIVIKADPITDDSQQALTVKNMEFVNAEVTDFHFDIQGECTTPFQIQVGKTKTCYVSYKACERGLDEQQLRIIATDEVRDEDDTATINLSANCVSPVLEIEPPELDFGYLLYERDGESIIVNISNQGDGELEIENIYFISNSNDHFELGNHDGLIGTTLEPGDSDDFVVVYDPEKVFDDSAIIGITTNDPNIGSGTTTLLAIGHGVEECPPATAPADDESAKCIPKCVPGEMICWPEGSHEYVFCNEDGETVGDPVTCESPIEICVNGAEGAVCDVPPCTPGRVYCLDDGHQMICNSEGIGYLEPTACDVSDPCNPEVCQEGAGCTQEKAEDETECDDGDPCTTGDHCSNGYCVWEEYRVCDDSEDCTTNDCNIADLEADPETGCVFKPVQNGKPCDDKKYCTIGDICDDGVCSPTSNRSCNDGNQCTDDACNEEENKCEYIADEDNTCTDNNACTLSDSCSDEGECISGQTNSCNDNNPCTWDVCVPGPEGGCQNTFLPGSCEDGNLCTVNDHCDTVLGVATCVAGTSKSCADSNPCTGPDTCVQSTGLCNNSILVGNSCTDNNLCTDEDTCQNVGGVGTCVPGDDLVCGNGETTPCKTWYCNPLQGCLFTINNNAACSDGNPCTLNDYCYSGSCTKYASVNTCNDNEFCTTDTCISSNPEGSECQHTDKLPSVLCDDDNMCTEGDHCSEGECLPGTPATDCCDDGNPCTEDSYDAVNDKCVYDPAPNSGDSCEDGNPCTLGDTCNASGACLPGAHNNAQCADSNDCTEDYCVTNIGCQHNPLSGITCNDGDPCYTGDMCSGGICQRGPTQTSCNDSNQCTNDYCLAYEGCQNDPMDNTPCNDGDPCYEGDYCDEGQCTQGVTVLSCGDSNDCTTDACVRFQGCKYTKLTGTDCSDGNLCTLSDICVNGECDPGSADTCSDSNDCTTDACNPSSGCSNVNNSNYCNDNDSCTTVDTCSGGNCVGSGLRDCNDYQVCTTDVCDADNPNAQSNGCVYTNNTVACSDDGNICTTDVCSGGACQHVNNTVTCTTDSNPCTNDVCASGSCQHIPNTDTCNDTNLCTLNDQCSGGVCAGTDKNCSSLDTQCTYGACNTTNGLCYEANKPNTTTSCDDSQWCSKNDYCYNGECVGADRCPNAQCRSLECNEATDTCGFATAGTDCDDGNSGTFDDQCDSSGNCAGSTTFTDPGDCGNGFSNMVRIPGTTWCADKYEAVVSRSNDCGSNYKGQSGSDYWSCFYADGSDYVCIDPKPRACSVANIKPSRWITFDQAKKACSRAGKELCSPELWARTCSENLTRTYPYGSTYEAQYCNGADYGDAHGGKSVRNTGSLTNCVGSYLALDMSGNAWEWTDSHNYSDNKQPIYGGAAWGDSNALKCSSWQDWTWDDRQDSVGFRCCVDLSDKRSVEEKISDYEESIEE